MKAPIRNILARTEGTASAIESLRVPASAPHRTGILLANNGPANLRVALIEAGDALPDLSESPYDLQIGPGRQVVLPLGASVQLALQGDGDDADYHVLELDGDPQIAFLPADLDGLMQAEDSAHASGDRGVMALAVINGAATAPGDDGDYAALQLDINGSLRVVSQPLALTPTVDTITSAPDSIQATINRAHFVLLYLASTGADADVEFEASIDGTTWTPIAGRRADGAVPLLQSGCSMESGEVAAFGFDLRGFTMIRANCTAISGGSLLAQIRPFTWPPDSQAAVALAQRVDAEGSLAPATGDSAPLQLDREGRLRIEEMPASSDRDWGYASGASGITVTTAVAVQAAAAAGYRQAIAGLQAMNAHATNATILAVRDGAGTVLWRMSLGPKQGISVKFARPLRTSTGATSNVEAICSAAAEVHLNVQGFLA